MDEKLKLCPFCGGEADLWYSSGRYGYFVYCQCSVCSAQSRIFHLGRDVPDDWADSTPATRATIKMIPPMVEWFNQAYEQGQWDAANEEGAT